jgi:hypothetical protein
MTKPETPLIEEEILDDDLPPSRKNGQPDPWHGLDDFEDEDVSSP